MVKSWDEVEQVGVCMTWSVAGEAGSRGKGAGMLNLMTMWETGPSAREIYTRGESVGRQREPLFQ